MKKFKLIILFFGAIIVFTGSKRFVATGFGSEKEFYMVLEYGIINGKYSSFVMNQPYELQTSIEILKLSSLNDWAEILNTRFSYFPTEENNRERINLRISPGLSESNKEVTKTTTMMSIDGAITIGNLLLVNRFRLNDATLKNDPEFHGDTGEWLFGYFDESYAIITLNNKIDLFLGRLNRNFGALNDYGLILSDNPYAFDHFGFTAAGSRLKFSFYTTRLNEIVSQDRGGNTVLSETVIKAKRYWAIQRLDWIIRENFQVALSEATVYGGPNQNWVASYMSPVQFFYAAQRNQNVQLNSMWQVNVFWKPKQGIGYYIDIFADDLIINNDPGVNDRAHYPDRLGFLIKTSMTNLTVPNTLTSFRYVRIWNDTYTSRRAYENYVYFEKGMGFPMTSFEGVKITHDWVGYVPWLLHIGFEIYRHGDVNLHQLFDGEILDFPIKPVTYGITSEFEISTPYWHHFEFEFKLKNDLTSLSTKKFFDNNHSSTDVQVKLLYQLQYIF